MIKALLVLSLSFACGRVWADPPASQYRITSANAKAISLTADCQKSEIDNGFFAVTRAAVRFSGDENSEVLTLTLRTVSAYAGRATCELAKEYANYTNGYGAYPTELLNAYSAVKHGDIIREWREGWTHPLCWSQYLDLFGSANDPTAIAYFTLARTPVRCP